MNSQILKKRVAGFTLIEIMVASAVFSLFTAGLFAFYRMGSNMFLTGSWKLTRQKEAERFLS
ncbi:MAG TPA: prepilin-type N-terminal cleavage/methylation domain-containing protein, partial [Candidatus Rifleibacterium sp.]|nr:prepilin-type N-terminal cleavage/methylation domain-containing protein [Candidatus Rifleibacterium sp.]